MKRKLSILDRSTWMHGLYSYVFAFTIRIKGSFSDSAFKEALRKTTKKYPLIGAHVVLDENDIAWFEWDENTSLSIRIVQQIDDSHWIFETGKELIKLYNEEEKIQTRFILLKGEDVSDLIIIFNHCTSDGISAVNLMRTIIDNLAHPDKTEEILQDPPPIEDILPFTEILVPPEFISWVETQIKNEKIPFEYLEDTTKNENVRIVPWNLTESQTIALIDRCRKEGVSVQSLFSTAFLAALTEVQSYHQDKSRRVYIGVDTRKYLTQNLDEAFGNYATLLGIDMAVHKYNPDKSFWENTRDFHKIIKFKLNPKSLLGFHPYMKSMSPIDIDRFSLAQYKPGIKNFYDYGINISNVGNIDFCELNDSLHIEAVYGPIINVPGIEKTLGTVTFGNRMYFTIAFRESIIATEVILQIRDRAMKYLYDEIG